MFAADRRPHPQLARVAMPRRVVAVAGAALAVGLALTACGGKTDTSSSQSTSSSAASTSGASSASIAASVPVPSVVPSSGKKVAGAVLARQIAAAAAKAGTVTFSMLATGTAQLNGQGVASGSGDKAQLRVSATVANSAALQVIKKDGVVYFKSPSQIMAGKAWIKVTNQPTDPYQALYKVFEGLEKSGDAKTTAKAIGAMGPFTVAGTEVVDGVQTTKYIGSPSVSKAIAILPTALEALTPRTLSKATPTVALWVDSTGLLHRTTTSFQLDGKPVSTSLVTYSGWGQPVSVVAPPAAQVASGALPTP